MIRLLRFFKIIKYRGVLPVLGRSIASRLSRFIITNFEYETALKIRALLILGYWPNIKTPRTFNEKILHRKVYKDDEKASQIADKWLTRKVVKEAGYRNILSELYFVTDNPAEIPFDRLPDKYVVKANYGSGRNVIVKDKNKTDIKSIVMKAQNWIENFENELRYASEIHYKMIKPRILVEEFLFNKNNEELTDYKFFCFNGRAEFINLQVLLDDIFVTAMFDRNWNQAPFTNYNKPIHLSISKPQQLNDMLEIADNLSEEFDFLRVDLYYIDNQRIVFGELSYNPGGGMSRIYPRKYDKVLGDLLNPSV